MSSPGNTATYSAHGKLLLFGEHAAVYGYPALGTSLPIDLGIQVQPGAAPAQKANMPDHLFPGLTAEEEDAALKLLIHARKLIPGLHFPPATYILKGSIPRSSGFGSSAALCVALARYVFSLSDKAEQGLTHLLPKFQHGWSDAEQQQYLLWHIANDLEKVFHGSPSGIDTGLAIRSGLTAFFPRSRRLPDVLPLPSPGEDIWLLYGAVPRVGNTKDLVGRIQKGMLEERPKVVEAIGKLGDIAHRAIDLLNSEHPLSGEHRGGNEHPGSISGLLGALADKAGEQLKNLQLNSPDMDRLLDKARKFGAAGGKLSGAGGGGAFWISTSGEDQARDLREQLTAFAMNRKIPLSEPLNLMKLH